MYLAPLLEPPGRRFCWARHLPCRAWSPSSSGCLAVRVRCSEWGLIAPGPPVSAAEDSYLPKAGFELLRGHFQLQRTHRGVSLDQGRINSLGMASHHAGLRAHRKYAGENFFKKRRGQQLPGSGDGRVPGKRLVELVTEEVEQVQAQATVLDETAVRVNVLQARHQAELEEDDRVNGGLAAAPVVGSRQLVEKL